MLSVCLASMMILFYALQPILCPPCPSSQQSGLWWSSHMSPSARVTLKSAKMSSIISDGVFPIDQIMTMPTVDQSMVCLVPSINLVIISTPGFSHFFPRWELMPGGKNWQKYPSAPLLWTKYQSNTLSSFGKKAIGGQVDSIYYTSTWHSLMESFWWGRPNIWLEGKGEYLGRIGHGKYFLFVQYRAFWALLNIDNYVEV